MARAIWSGTIAFGLVAVPVKAVTAVKSHDFSAHQLNAKTGNRVQQKRVDAVTGEEVPYADIVKGFEVSPDIHVVMSPAELAAINVKSTKSIEIDGFVNAEEIDPMLLDGHYYLEPDAGGDKSYALLNSALSTGNKVAVGRVTLRSREYPCIIRNNNAGVLVMTTMNYPDEIVPPTVANVNKVEVSERETAMAASLVESMTVPFDVSEYRDRYTDSLRTVINDKYHGNQTVVAQAEEPVQLNDLMAALEASLVAAKKTKPKKAKSA